jgi:hypothetical protein
MPTSVTWNGSSRSIPSAGELNWSALSAFLVDVATNAQTTNFQKISIRTALATPVTVAAATDCVIVTNLTVAGAVAVTLPAGSSKQVFYIVDGKGDAATNNITITPASGTINGSATYVISTNRAGVGIIFDGSNWVVFAEYVAEAVTRTGTQVITNKDIDGGTASNTHRITLPKETTTNLNALTRKQGTLFYDTTTNSLKFDDGSTLITLSQGDMSQGVLTTNASQASKTIASGTTLGHPNLSIQSGHTYTVNSGGSLVCPVSLTVVTGGNLTVNTGGNATVVI